jgi:hypothetical protein
MTDDYDVKCFTGATRKQSELAAAFSKVANKANWKLPISRATLRHGMPQDEQNLITDAIVHFTGSVPRFKQDHVWFVVEADGYYRAVGA